MAQADSEKAPEAGTAEADTYALIDRTSHVQAERSLEALTDLVRQGRLFRSDLVVKNGASARQLGELPEVAAVFDELMPATFAADDLRAAPTLIGRADPLAICGVFSRLWRDRRTGRLFVRNEAGAEWMVAFREGRPINATSNVEREAIGEMLIAQGLIDADAFNEAVEHRKAMGGRIGSALISLDKLSKRDLNRVLSLQAMERLVNVFRQPAGTFRYVPGDNAAQDEMRLLVSVRDIIETGLATGLPAVEVTRVLSEMGDPVLRVEVSEGLADGLSESDQQVLGILGGGARLSVCLPQMAQAAALTIAEARTRVLALMRYGVIGVADETFRALEATLQRLQGFNYFRVLDVRRADAAPAIEAAFKARVAEYGAAEVPDDVEFVRAMRGQIREVLDRARRTLLDEDERTLYERAVQLGLDFDDAEVRRRLEHELLLTRGKSLLEQQKYSEAQAAFVRADKLVPGDARLRIQIGWATFLGSARDTTAASEAVRDVRRAIEMAGDSDEAQLYIGKIYRLSGDATLAEDHLRKAIALKPNNNEAQSELRLLFSRELDRGKGGAAASIKFEGSAGLSVKVSIFAALVFVLLYVGANMLPGGLTVWPDAKVESLLKLSGGEQAELNALPQIRLNYDEEQMLAAARRLKAPETVNNKEKAFAYLRTNFEVKDILEALKSGRTVAPDQQVLGNGEYFFAIDDMWWWARRGVLLVMGLLGILLFLRRDTPLLIGGERVGLGLAGIPYGVVVGFLAAPIEVVSPDLGPLLGMASFHVLAEAVFFFAFLGRAFFKDFKEIPGVAVGLCAVLYALYHATYFSVLQLGVGGMLPDLIRIGAFGGAAYMGIMWLSRGGLLGPTLAHLAMWFTLIIRSAMV